MRFTELPWCRFVSIADVELPAPGTRITVHRNQWKSWRDNMQIKWYEGRPSVPFETNDGKASPMWKHKLYVFMSLAGQLPPIGIT